MKSNETRLGTGLSRRSLLRGAGAVAAGGMIGGLSVGRAAWAQAGDDALVAAARKEGRLVLYTSAEESIVAGLSRAFGDRYGVQIEYQRLNSRDLAGRFTAERDAGKTVADMLFSGDIQFLNDLAAAGNLARLETGEIPGLDAWPAEFHDEFQTIVSINPQTMGINTDLVKTVPASWKAMLEPEFKDQIAVLDLKRVGIVTFYSFDLLLKTHGDDFIAALGRQQPRLFDSGPSAIQQVAAGAARLFFPASVSQAMSMVNQGAPVKAVIPEGEPYTGVLLPFSITRDAPSPASARLLASFMLTPEAQAIINKNTASPINAPGTGALPPGFVKPSDASAAANKDKIIQLMGQA